MTQSPKPTFYVMSFRAELEGDVDRVLKLAEKKGIDVRDVAIAPLDGDKVLLDREVQLLASVPAHEFVKVVNKVVDAHVIADSLRPIPLKENSLHRNGPLGGAPDEFKQKITQKPDGSYVNTLTCVRETVFTDLPSKESLALKGVNTDVLKEWARAIAYVATNKGISLKDAADFKGNLSEVEATATPSERAKPQVKAKSTDKGR